ncbi:MAG: hypothetical protein AAF889_08840 [Cyanobacteria bacterium P01_D01_bin.73]
MDARALSRQMPGIYQRLTRLERILSLVLAEQKYIRGEIRRLNTQEPQPPEAIDDCLEALGFPLDKFSKEAPPASGPSPLPDIPLAGLGVDSTPAARQSTEFLPFVPDSMG